MLSEFLVLLDFRHLRLSCLDLRQILKAARGQRVAAWYCLNESEILIIVKAFR